MSQRRGAARPAPATRAPAAHRVQPHDQSRRSPARYQRFAPPESTSRTPGGPAPKPLPRFGPIPPPPESHPRGRPLEPLGLDGAIRHARGPRVARQRRITGRSPPPRSHHEPHEQHEQRRRTGNRDPPFHARYLPSVVLRGAPVNLLVTTG